MAKTDEQRGPVAAWMRRERLARGWTQKDVADRIDITEMSYRAYEAGPRVSVPVRRALEAVYGTTPPDPSTSPPAAGDMAALVDALRDQTAAINRLVDRLGSGPTQPEWENLARLAAQLVTAPSIGEGEAPPSSQSDEAPPVEAEPEPAGSR